MLSFLAQLWPEDLKKASEKVAASGQQKKSEASTEHHLPPHLLPNVTEVTKEDKRWHAEEINEGRREELKAWMKHVRLKRRRAQSGMNLVDTTWVFKWKYKPNGTRFCKARLCVRGYKDSQKADVATYAFTATRESQRLVTSTAVIMGWRLRSMDVSTAFLQGAPFGEGREVSLKVDKELAKLLRQYEGYEDFDENLEVLSLDKLVYGLVDAPKAWFDELTATIKAAGWIQALLDPALLFKRSYGKLSGIMSLHVDDIKTGGTDSVMAELSQILKRKYGEIKEEMDNFEHCGVMHNTTEERGHDVAEALPGETRGDATRSRSTLPSAA